MNAKHWIIVEAIIDKALQQPVEKQEAYLNKACHNNNILREEVMHLWRAMKTSKESKFLQRATKENQSLISDLTDEKLQTDFIGKRIGTYKITEKIGSGGMGGVFKAVRADGQFTREVAIKIVPKGFHSRQTLKRFALEKQILANLSHQNIASLYDGGVSGEGHPYLVIEYINGMPIDKYCNRHRLPVNARLKLFKDVCKAIEFAHRNLVIHRDIKANNIYVTTAGQVKVLDFGIAKLLDPELGDEDLKQTFPNCEFWTPRYAAPEQVQGKQITTATDIYSLGVLLHRLLTDTYPFNFKDKSISEICNQIKNERPRTLWQSLKMEDLNKVAKLRDTTSAEFKKMVTGDIEAIVCKAMHHDPNKRYGSAGQLASDINNLQTHIPVKARKPKMAYRSRKFIRRHSKGLVISAMVFCIIAALTIFYTVQLSKKQHAATLQAKKTRRVESLLTDIFKQSAPITQSPKKILLTDILNQGSKEIKVGLPHQPLVKAELLGLIGQIYTNLGFYSPAEPLLRQAVQLQEHNEQTEPKIYIQNLNRLAYLFCRQGKVQKSERLYLQAINKAKLAYNSHSSELVPLYRGLGMLYDKMGNRKKAVQYYQMALGLVAPHQKKLKTILQNDVAMIYQKKDTIAKP